MTLIAAAPAGNPALYFELRVDGKPVAGMTLDEVGQQIMGEAGTKVRIKVVRGAGNPR